mmetsp:Transcript_26543/g.54779  ORF Transcript_26543/g.54779 Transcript_26543/m.54779 type:complete len:327 (-) Transcript_26543:426-1406(-)
MHESHGERVRFRQERAPCFFDCLGPGHNRPPPRVVVLFQEPAGRPTVRRQEGNRSSVVACEDLRNDRVGHHLEAGSVVQWLVLLVLLVVVVVAVPGMLPHKADPFLRSGMKVQEVVHGGQKRGIESRSDQDVHPFRIGGGLDRSRGVLREPPRGGPFFLRALPFPVVELEIGVPGVRRPKFVLFLPLDSKQHVDRVAFRIGFFRRDALPGFLVVVVVDDDLSGGEGGKGTKVHVSRADPPKEGCAGQDAVPDRRSDSEHDQVAGEGPFQAPRGVPSRLGRGWGGAQPPKKGRRRRQRRRPEALAISGRNGKKSCHPKGFCPRVGYP